MNVSRRQLVQLSALLAVTSGALVACSPSAGSGARVTPSAGFVPGKLDRRFAGTTITVVMPSWAQTPTSMLADFESKTGIKVVMQDAGGDYNAMHDKFVTTAAAGQSIGDVIEVGFDWVGQFGAAGWLTPLGAYVDATTASQTVGGNAFQYKGGLLGIPWNIDIRGSIANMTMFHKAGVDTPPTTWAEVLEGAKRIKAAGIAKYPIGVPLSNTEGTSTMWYALQRGAGGTLVSPTGAPEFASNSAAVDSLRFIRDLYSAGLVDPGSIGLKDTDVNDQFGARSSAMILAASPASLGTFADASASKTSSDDVRFLHLPGQSDDTGLTLNFNEALSIPKASKSKEAAALYITWRSQQQQYLKTYLDPKLGGLPPTTAAIEALADQGKLLGGDDIVSLLKNVGPLIQGGPPTWYGAFSTATASDIQKVALGKLTPKAAVDDLKRQALTLANK